MLYRTNAHQIADLLLGKWPGLEVAVAQSRVVWQDGPALDTAVSFIRATEGDDPNQQPAAEPDCASYMYGVAMSRKTRIRTAVLAHLRGDLDHYHGHHYRNYPTEGLQPADGTEAIVVTVVTDHLNSDGPLRWTQGLPAIVATAIADLGGVHALTAAAAAARAE